jgi:glycosyltransferase involved in cell wall biosynthesis
MDLDNPVLSHQVEAVESLSEHFEQTFVISGKIGRYRNNPRITVVDSNWIPGQSIRNSVKFLLRISKTILQNRSKVVVFSHMTEVQSALIAIPLRIMRVPHFLWYAHAHESIYLKWVHFWATGIITSTNGSCPIKSRKVHVVGQAINLSTFRMTKENTSPMKSLVHIGRTDPSKGIETIYEVVSRVRKDFPELALTFIGEPSNLEARQQFDSFVCKTVADQNEGWLQLHPSIPREQISETLLNHDIFIHAFRGSLDKSILEATAVGLPVVTQNTEYLNLFGQWSNESFLESELRAVLRSTKSNILSEVYRKRMVLEKFHSLSSWSQKISNLLLDENRPTQTDYHAQ